MKKEYTEIFWGLYAIKKDAEKLQEQFMPEKDRALLKNFIYGCSCHNLEIVFWPETHWEAGDDKFFDLTIGSSLEMPVEDINWNDPESHNLKLSSHIKLTSLRRFSKH